jgi:hypothetical protein
MNNTLLERVILILKNESSSEREFANKIGSNPKTINQQIKGERAISLDTISNILSSIEGVSSEWLLRGEGEMYKSPFPESSGKSIGTIEEYNEAIGQGINLIPEVNFKFAAGQTSLVNGRENITRYWFLPDCRDCEGVAQVVGNSMAPVLPSGCWVALKKYSFSPNRSTQIPFGSVFGIVVEDTDTGDYHGYIKVLRRYKEADLCKKYWIAHSINEKDFDDFDIDISQVRSLWVVKQHVVSDILL